MFLITAQQVNEQKAKVKEARYQAFRAEFDATHSRAKVARLNSKRDDAEVLFQEAEIIQEHLQKQVAMEIDSVSEAKATELNATTRYNLAMARQIVDSIVTDL